MTITRFPPPSPTTTTPPDDGAYIPEEEPLTPHARFTRAADLAINGTVAPVAWDVVAFDSHDGLEESDTATYTVRRSGLYQATVHLRRGAPSVNSGFWALIVHNSTVAIRTQSQTTTGTAGTSAQALIDAAEGDTIRVDSGQTTPSTASLLGSTGAGLVVCSFEVVRFGPPVGA